MRLIAVDIGNSATKIALFQIKRDAQPGNQDRSLTSIQLHATRLTTVRLERNSFPHGLVDDFNLLSDSCPWFVSSVHQERQQALASWVTQHRPQDSWHLLGSNDIPLESSVDCREQVGKDRLLAALAAHWNPQLPTATPRIVVDAGTAVTIDLVSPDGTFIGGNIFLGADAIFKQISGNTDALPSLDHRTRLQRMNQWHAAQSTSDELVAGRLNPSELAKRTPFSLGKNTMDAILSGVYRSQIGALTSIVASLKHECELRFKQTASVLLTGGGWEELKQVSRMLDASMQEANRATPSDPTPPCDTLSTNSTAETPCPNPRPSSLKFPQHWQTDSLLVLKGVALAGLHLLETR